MGCGQSVDSAYGNRNIGSRNPMWAQGSAGRRIPPPEELTEPVLDRATLDEYMQTERAIAEAQRADPGLVERLKTKTDALEALQAKCDNPQSKVELVEAKLERDKLSVEVEELRDQASELQILQLRQDDLLAKIFGGGHRTKRELALEQELGLLEAQRARVMEANFKWRQAQMMMEYACRQLAVAVQKWQDLPDIPTIDLEIRYTMTTEARARLMSAQQHAHKTGTNTMALPNSGQENDALDQEVACVFETDEGDDPETARRKMENNHQKASSLLRWFEQVLNTTIMQDLEAINRQVRETTLALRDERVRIIKHKVREIWGTDVEIEIEEETPTGQKPRELTDAELVQPDQAMLEEYLGRMTPVDYDGADGQPQQSSEELFGKSYEEFKQELDNMRDEHETEMGLFLQDQDRQAAKVRNDLKAKLEARRQYRAMRNIESKQKAQLARGAVVT